MNKKSSTVKQTQVILELIEHLKSWTVKNFVKDIQVSAILILHQKKIRGIGVLGVGAPKHKVGALEKIGSKP